MSNLATAISRAKSHARTALGQIQRDRFSVVDVYDVAASFGIEVTPASFKDDQISGFFKQDAAQSAQIVFNKNHVEARQRFTIAHEIGHFILHAHESLHVDHGTSESVYFRDADSSKATKLKEIEANQFAAELLMPSDEIQELVQEQIREGKTVDDAVFTLAKKYDVSFSAMAIKIGSAAH